MGIYGVICLLFSMMPGLRHSLHSIRGMFGEVLFPMPAPSISWALGLIILAGALTARKRLAWWVLFIIQAFFCLLTVVGLWLFMVDSFEEDFHIPWIGWLKIAIQFLLMVAVLISYPFFPARTQPASIRKALAVYVLGQTAVFTAGCALAWVFPGHMPRSDIVGWVAAKAYIFSLVDVVGPHSHPNWIVGHLIALGAAVVFVWTAITLFQAQKDANALTADDEVAIRAMIARWNGDDSLAYFATRRDKAVIYSPDGRAAVTYRTELGVSLASGDPIGNPAAWDAAIRAWQRQAARYGWTTAVMGASAKGAHAYQRHGYQTLHLGDEAVLYTDAFTLRGTEAKSVRQAVARARRAGVRTVIRRHGELSAAEMDSIQADADRWRDTTDERGFSMALGRLGDPADHNNLLVEAFVGQRRVALLSFSPWGKSGASLDLMRRAHDAPNGTIEKMVADLMEAGRDVGVTHISLNFAVFRQVFAMGESLASGPIMQIWHGLLMFFSRWWQMEALYRSNEKYNPTWVPRYICYTKATALARVGLVAGIAEGFVNFPVPGPSNRRTTGNQRREGLDAALALAPQLLAEASGTTPTHHHHRPEQVAVRLGKAHRLLQSGIDPWPVAQPPSHSCAHASTAKPGDTISLAGRIMGRRNFGSVMFLDLKDFSGSVQIILDAATTADFATWRSRLDLGDLIGVTGRWGASRTGTPSLIATSLRFEAKSLQPLPNKHTGLTDPEARVRARHVDLAVNQEPRLALTARSAILHTFRTLLHNQGYVEVETPILQQVHGGANAKPFTTHINAYNLDLYLRIAPELYLKRLLCGGVDRVFEIGRNFRNEGVDSTHNPEFTALEAYCAHGDYDTMLELTHELIVAAATAVHGAPIVMDPDGNPVDISGPWPVKTVMAAISEGLRADGLLHGPDLTVNTPCDELADLAARAGITLRPDADAGAIIEELYDEFVESRTTFPTFYKDFPVSVSPLTRRHRTLPGLTERWDLVAWGVELGTAYSELTNPIDQRERLEAQSLLAAGGDPEAMEVDEEFLSALEFGMPPTGGLGIGVDRIVMLITGSTIRQSLAFPLAVRQRN